MTEDQTISSERTSSLLPLFIVSALLLSVVPWLHPVGTCTHWLEKWGEASEHRIWVPIHQMAMVGFALAAGAAMLVPVFMRRSMSTVMAAALMSGGFMITAFTAIIHATSVSTLGRAYRAAIDPAERNMLRTVAEAMVSYDVASTAASSAMISAGSFILTIALFRRGALSIIPAVVLAGLSLIWAFQYHGVFNRLGFSVPETIHWASLSLWLAGIGLVIFRMNEPRVGASRVEGEAASRATVAATAE